MNCSVAQGNHMTHGPPLLKPSPVGEWKLATHIAVYNDYHNEEVLTYFLISKLIYCCYALLRS